MNPSDQPDSPPNTTFLPPSQRRSLHTIHSKSTYTFDPLLISYVDILRRSLDSLTEFLFQLFAQKIGFKYKNDIILCHLQYPQKTISSRTEWYKTSIIMLKDLQQLLKSMRMHSAAWARVACVPDGDIRSGCDVLLGDLRNKFAHGGISFSEEDRHSKRVISFLRDMILPFVELFHHARSPKILEIASLSSARFDGHLVSIQSVREINVLKKEMMEKIQDEGNRELVKDLTVSYLQYCIDEISNDNTECLEFVFHDFLTKTLNPDGHFTLGE
eukprot:TRINITY_DN2157_c0_g1_i1.p1 TRINITY_DN2157_c0_g1~~TRINITY_DN2157_c0_g1_i1.p1  ORF type:complete len:283 (-),score=33.36 TRINITY_DN2157_c0_g1_i1:1261-2076(-)